MPVVVRAEIERLSQKEFGKVAYDVMRELFALHRELGRLFDEKVYQAALTARMESAQSEVRINVSFEGFRKSYLMDVLVSKGAVFELKTVAALTNRHRSQLLNYLLLTGLYHGKLVNLRSDRVEHEFVNTRLTHAERITFDTDDSEWQATAGFGSEERTLVEEMLRDWGTGLACALYREAMVYLLGGAEQVLAEVDVCMNGTRLAKQPVALCAERTAFRLTTFDSDTGGYRKGLTRFLTCAELDAIQWVNISRKQLTFETVS